MSDRNTRERTLAGYLRIDGLVLITNTARCARERAYAPYSEFRVGAAILAFVPVPTANGWPKSLHVFGGGNVENAAFGACDCAEIGALMAAFAAGAGPDDIIACYVDGTSRPCADCLQKLAEFAPLEDPIMIHCSEGNGGGEWLPLHVLLPNQFPNPGNRAAITRTPITVPPGRVAITASGLRRSDLLHQYEAHGIGLARMALRVPHGYSPYSGYQVRALVLTCMRADSTTPWERKTFAGCNTENAVHGLTVCAERAALCSALAGGTLPRDIIACAIIGQTDEPVSMCGGCRQFFSEFSPFEDPIMIFCGNKRGEGTWEPLTQILPRPFP